MKDKEQHIIDTTVRQALENLETPYVADHWQLMAGKLDALDIGEAEFDNNLADILRGIEALYCADHWQLMADKLGALDAADAEFDNNLADKIKGIEVPYVASNWADMSARLDDLDDSETTFDALLSQRLENLQVKYQPSHWNYMAQQIEETFSWRAKVVRYKLVEVALVLLTLFTVGNMLDLPFDSDYSNTINTGVKVEKTNKTKANDVKKAAPEKKKETKTFYNNPMEWRTRPAIPNDTKLEQNGVSKPVVASNSMPLDATSNPVVVQLKNIVEKEPLNNVINNVTNNSVNNIFDGGVLTIVSSPNLTAQTSEIIEGYVLDKLPMKKVLALGRVKDEEPVDNQTVIATASKVLHSMEILKPSLLNTRFYDENLTFPLFVEKKAKWRLNIFGLPIADMVSYNYVKNRTKETEHQIASNLGAGVAFAYKKNNWDIETGLTYLDKKYYLPNVEVTTGSVLRGFKTEKPLSVRLSIVSIPLSTNYTFKEIQRWRFYARVGAALNTIFSSKEVLFVESSNSSNAQAPAQNNISEYEPNVYPKGVFRKGFFKNNKWYGGFKENAYLTANTGLGVEYRFTNKLNIYVQPTMDYHIGKNGIGSLNDRINSFSVQGGVKMNMK